YSYAPPTRVHIIDDQGRPHLQPFVYGIAQDLPSAEYHEDRSRRYPIHFLVGGRLFGVDPPRMIFLCGSDVFGRDVFSRMIYGGRISVLTGLLAASLALSLGAGAGTLAGFYGGKTDWFLMRAGELFQCLPWLYLLLAIRAVLPLHISAIQ